MVGFPHSEIAGSKLIRSSPTLIAAYYVLHRLCTPRHPLNALKTLDRSHYQCPQHHRHRSPLEGSMTTSSGLSIANASLRQHFDRSDQINQISRGIFVPPRGAGQTGQKAISLRCRKIRMLRAKAAKTSKLALLISHVVYFRDQNQSPSQPRSKVPIQPNGWWWSQTGSNRRHPACKAGALPAELWPHSLSNRTSVGWPGQTRTADLTLIRRAL